MNQTLESVTVPPGAALKAVRSVAREQGWTEDLLELERYLLVKLQVLERRERPR